MIGDKGLSGAEIEGLVASLGAFMRPDRKDEALRFGSLGAIRRGSRQSSISSRISSPWSGTVPTTPEGLWARVLQRLLALGATIWHNWRLWEAGEFDGPVRSLIAYDH